MSWKKIKFSKEKKEYYGLSPGDLVLFHGASPWEDDNILSFHTKLPVILDKNDLGIFIQFCFEQINKCIWHYAKVLINDQIYLINPHFLEIKNDR